MTTSMRSQVKTWIIENLAPRLEQLEQRPEISHGWPGKNLGRNHVWIDRTVGTVSFDLSMAGRKLRDDTFTVRLIFQASGPGDSIAETDARVETYCAEFEDLIAERPFLSDDEDAPMDGLIHAIFDDNSIEGPMGEWTDEGAVSFMFADLTVHTRT